MMVAFTETGRPELGRVGQILALLLLALLTAARAGQGATLPMIRPGSSHPIRSRRNCRNCLSCWGRGT